MSNIVIIGCVAVASGVLGFFLGIGFGADIGSEIDLNFDEEDYEGWNDKQ
jgi:hypothetical protein